MIEGHFVPLQFPMSAADFVHLPRHPAYRYEHFNDTAWLTPQQRWYHAELDLETFSAPPDIAFENQLAVRPFAEADWEGLPALFAASFGTVPPYGCMDEKRLLEASRECIEQTRHGGDGPIVAPACFSAVDEKQRVRGCVLITLIRPVDLTDSSSECRWKGAASDSIGRPHLTWIFVSPAHSGHGAGTRLLAAAMRQLLLLGYQDLASTFLLGNEASALWHWRNGFRLLGHPQSWRELRKRWLV